MNERQRAAFLWGWSRRRRMGLGGFLLLGLGVGAVGGLVFAGAMLFAMTANGGTFRVAEEDLSGLMLWFAQTLGPTGFLFAISIPAFAGLGAVLALFAGRRIEWQYQNLLAQGAQPPQSKPQLTWKDRAPSYVVLAGLALLVIWACYMLWRDISTGVL
jgi:hypothetical protein